MDENPILRGHSQAVIHLKKLATNLQHFTDLESDVHLEIVGYSVSPDLASFKTWLHISSGAVCRCPCSRTPANHPMCLGAGGEDQCNSNTEALALYHLS
ncbi:unnamed protein product [Gadus morhua 'NCC']